MQARDLAVSEWSPPGRKHRKGPPGCSWAGSRQTGWVREGHNAHRSSDLTESEFFLSRFSMACSRQLTREAGRQLVRNAAGFEQANVYRKVA